MELNEKKNNIKTKLENTRTKLIQLIEPLSDDKLSMKKNLDLLV